MRVVIGFFAVAALATTPALSQEVAPMPAEMGPTPPQLGALNFDVLRNGDRFGSALLTFEKDGEDIVITSDVDLTVKIGFITAFRYRHDVVERWRDGQLQSLDSTTLKDGDDLAVTVRRTPDGLMVNGPAYSGLADGDLLATHWWNAGVVDETTLINTETGALMDVVIEPLGTNTLTANGQNVDAQCYQLAATMTLTLCYDDDDRWVSTAFTARGSEVEYVLTSGQGG